jgi:hypothetical protein
MDAVEITFDLAAYPSRRVGDGTVVVFRYDTLELPNLAAGDISGGTVLLVFPVEAASELCRLLGRLLSQSAAGRGSPTHPTVLMRSQLTVEASDASFSFLRVPRIGSLDLLLDRLGVGSAAAA